jgi:Zn-dependent M28 family amino/carboxypeptidase
MIRPALLSSLLILAAACGGKDAPDDTAATPDDGTSARTPVTAEPAPDKLLLPLPDNTSTTISEADLAVRIGTLASDTFEGRGPGSEAGEASADWIAAEMQRVGLQPGGPEGSWFQTVEMVEQTVQAGDSFVQVETPEGVRDLELKADAVIWTKQQDVEVTEIEASELVFIGYGAVAPEYDWNDYEGLDLAGKTVVMLVNDPGFATGDDALFNGKAMTYYGRWTYKYEEAARQGAAGAIIIHETEPASYGWDVVASSWSGAQADLVRRDGGRSRALMEGWITNEVARELFAAAGEDFDTLKAAASTRDFAPVPLEGLRLDARVSQTVKTGESRNVIGVLPGTKAPEETILYVAHWDHLGLKDNFLEDKIYNGAVDNATGTAALLEIAEAMAAAPRQRSVMFLAVTLEESGLLGSAYFAENPTVDLADIVAGMNMDGMLPTGPARDMVVVGFGASQLEDRLADLLAAQDRVVRPDPTPEAGYFYRSDHISLAKEGVPMLYADGGTDLIEGGMAVGEAAAMAYTRFDYHKPGDEYAPDWDLSGMAQDVRILFELGAGLANSGDWPNWYEGNEFRALRDAQRAGRD